MSSSRRRMLLLGAGLVCAILAIQWGCFEYLRTPISWDSPRMLQIKREWDLLWRPPIHSKDEYEDRANTADRLLRRRLPYRDLRHLAFSCESLPVLFKDRSDFTNAVLAFMVKAFVDAGDRNSLVALISTRCPLRIELYDDLEFWLVLRGKKLKDPILILGEAYAKCQVPDVRREIAGAVRRGFAGLEIDGKDDSAYVKNAMQWYEKERAHLAVNLMYWHNAMLFPVEEYDRFPDLYVTWRGPFKRELLFVSAPAKRGSE